MELREELDCVEVELVRLKEEFILYEGYKKRLVNR